MRNVFVMLLITTTLLLSSSVTLFLLREAEIEKRVALEGRVEEIEGQKLMLSTRLDKMNAVKKELETKVIDLELHAQQIEADMQEARKQRGLAVAQLEAEKRESKRLLDELMKVRSEKEQIALDLDRIRNEGDTLKSQLYSIQQAKEILEKKFKEALAKSEVELEKIIVKPEPFVGSRDRTDTHRMTHEPFAAVEHSLDEFGESAQLSDVNGEIMVVNKQFDFAVINLGSDDGLRNGMNLGVYRDRRFLAMIEVERTHDNMSAARIPRAWRDADIREGDMVVLK